MQLLTMNQVEKETITYHVFHIGSRGKNFSSYFVMVIKNGKHVVLRNITLPPGFIRGVCSVAVRWAKYGEIGAWQQRGLIRNTRCQCTCSARYAQKY